MPALPSSVLEPLWVQIAALLPDRQVHHPLGCHRPRIPDRLVFDKLIQVLVFGCGDRRIADQGYGDHPAPPPGGWIRCRGGRAAAPCGAGRLGRLVGLELEHQGALRRPDCRAQSGWTAATKGRKRSLVTGRAGIPLVAVPAQPTSARTGCWPPPWTLSGCWARCPSGPPCIWTPAMTTSGVGRS